MTAPAGGRSDGADWERVFAAMARWYGMDAAAVGRLTARQLRGYLASLKDVAAGPTP